MKAKKQKVSVIIAYNENRGWLNEAVDSVVSGQVFDKKLLEVQLIEVHGKNRNISENLNVGIRMATGDFIKYLSEDDLLTPNCIRDSVAAFTPDVDFIHGNAINFFEDGRRPQVYSPIHKTFDLKFMMDFLKNKTNFVHGGTLMFRKSFFKKVGMFDTKLTCAEEHELVLRGLSKGMRIGYTPTILYKYRRHNKQKSLGVGVNQAERAAIVKGIHDKYRKLCS